ncbi:hypothetical protein [Clostridium sp.]|uniref:hypothetical protein n=1 Tax=Clostridium sp. TaxID=1506 RepID=UPI003D6D2899
MNTRKGKVKLMDKNGNDYYLEKIKNKTIKLDQKKSQYEVEIMQQNNLLEHNNYAMQNLNSENDVLSDEYNSLIRLLHEQGIIFEMIFYKYTPHQWENLFIIKNSKGYEIQTKSGSVLRMLDEKFSKIIEDIDKKDAYSLIVIRVTDKTALVQLRFN